MSDSTRDERLQIMLTQDELKALDDWRFSRRMPSRAAAVRELLRLGLAAEGITVTGQGRRSREFGVMTGGHLRNPGAQYGPPEGDGAG